MACLLCMLQDHNAVTVPLVWKVAVDVFKYFQPKTMPEFDGYRSETISAEVSEFNRIQAYSAFSFFNDFHKSK